MAVKNLTLKDFDKFIGSGNSVIDFYADWCGPCKIISPIVEQLSKEIKDVKFGKLDVDTENEVAQEYDVMSIPTLIFFKNGKQVERIVGAMSKEELESVIKDTFT